ncbi:acrosomal protein SP-10 [Rhinolophus sinicus]|uniref:acrosomal protein SP-10 n=1 Tax=Rhinolophus sinicus TaxID=89399 RepID=UPI003D7BBE3A
MGEEDHSEEVSPHIISEPQPPDWVGSPRPSTLSPPRVPHRSSPRREPKSKERPSSSSMYVKPSGTQDQGVAEEFPEAVTQHWELLLSFSSRLLGAPHKGPLFLKIQMKFLLLMSFYLLGSARGASGLPDEPPGSMGHQASIQQLSGEYFSLANPSVSEALYKASSGKNTLNEHASGEHGSGEAASGDPKSGVSEQASGEHASSEQPSGEQPSGGQPSVEQPSGEQPSGEQPSVEQPSGEQPSVEQPSGEQPSVEQPSGEQPSVEQPSGEQPSVEQHSGEQPSVEQPSAEQPSGEQASGGQPLGEQPSGEQPTGGQPSGGQASSEQPTGDQVSGEKSLVEQPSGSPPSSTGFIKFSDPVLNCHTCAYMNDQGKCLRGEGICATQKSQQCMLKKIFEGGKLQFMVQGCENMCPSMNLFSHGTRMQIACCRNQPFCNKI